MGSTLFLIPYAIIYYLFSSGQVGILLLRQQFQSMWREPFWIFGKNVLHYRDHRFLKRYIFGWFRITVNCGYHLWRVFLSLLLHYIGGSLNKSDLNDMPPNFLSAVRHRQRRPSVGGNDPQQIPLLVGQLATEKSPRSDSLFGSRYKSAMSRGWYLLLPCEGDGRKMKTLAEHLLQQHLILNWEKEQVWTLQLFQQIHQPVVRCN